MSNVSVLGDRFKEFRKKLELSQTDIANALSIKASAVSQIENGKIKPSPDSMVKLSQTYSLNLHWLLTGNGSQFADKLFEISSEAPLYYEDDDEVVILPVNAEISAGKPVAPYNGEDPLDYVPLNKEMIDNPSNYISFRVNGHSMEPDIMDRDLVIVKKTAQWRNVEHCVCAVRIDGELTLKRLTRSNQKSIYILESINKDYDPIIVDTTCSEFGLLGKLKYIFRVY